MIGIFDSGLGGLAVLKRVRDINKNIDVALLADQKHAPYGTKSERELIRLVKNDIRLLENIGAEKILIGCCTASTVYAMLSKKERALSLPIIAPSAKEALSVTQNGKIGVIGTRATIASKAFSREISALCSECETYENEAQALVSLVEGGCRDGAVTSEGARLIYGILKPLKAKNIDTLILGCTHFDWLFRTVAEYMPKVRVVSSPKAGALEMMKEYGYEKGCANTFYIGTREDIKNVKIQKRKNK